VRDHRAFQHPRFARCYEKLSIKNERRGIGEHRARLLAGLAGRVVEVGAGNGLNFAHYPDTVTEVVAVEPDDYLRARAEEAAALARVLVTVVAGDAECLPVADSSADAAVLSLVLCSVPEQARALAETRRALRPAGTLRFYEHVRSDKPALALAEDLVDPLWSRIGGGCHLGRDTAAAIPAAGFVLDDLERFIFRPSPLVAQAHVFGTAHHPGHSPSPASVATRC
jgi:SAM-dependent methyltransferase